MDQKKSKNPSPRIKVIQKIYNFLMNPNSEINFPKHQYKKLLHKTIALDFTYLLTFMADLHEFWENM